MEGSTCYFIIYKNLLRLGKISILSYFSKQPIYKKYDITTIYFFAFKKSDNIHETKEPRNELT